MRTLKLTISYDGTRHAGWQIQAHSTQQTAHRRHRPTIQGTLERVLRHILQEPVRVVGSGRTDAGVHAIAQVAHLRTRSSISCERLQRSLNQLLPKELAVTRLEEAPDDFHARFCAVSKRYRYRVFRGPVVPPFIVPYVHQVRAPLNLALMRREAAALHARHDFRAFARLRKTPRSTVRILHDVQINRRGDELHIDLEGNGFLHTMVRSIVGTLLDIGRGHLPPGTIRAMLRSRDRCLAGTTAPAKGLTLVSVTYAP